MLPGFRFRKSFKVFPGVKLNLSKSGLSTSIGEKGRTINLGRKGNKATVGLPGSGMSYQRPFQTGKILYWIVTVAVVGYVLYGLLR